MPKGRRKDWDQAELEAFLATAPIYYQPWWLEAVSPGNWDYVVVRRQLEIAAVLPFVRYDMGMGQVGLGMPEMTHTLGPWLGAPALAKNRSSAERAGLMFDLIDRIPPVVHFRQNFHHSVTDWLPFYWRGFSQTSGHTYVIEDLSDLDRVWKGFAHDVRTSVRKAQRRLRVLTDPDVATFNQIRVKSLARQGRPSAWPLRFVRRVDEACVQHNARKIFAAVDTNDRIHAVVYMAWTNCTAYLIMGGGDPDLRHSGANCLLIWEAIRSARDVAETLDFEMGAPTPPIEHFFRQFGGRLVRYFCVSKDRRGVLSKSWSTARHWCRRFREPVESRT